MKIIALLCYVQSWHRAEPLIAWFLYIKLAFALWFNSIYCNAVTVASQLAPFPFSPLQTLCLKTAACP